MSDQEKLKARAAEYVLSLIQDDMIIGLGTGSTVKYFLHDLEAKIQNGELNNIKGIPSSRRTEKIANDLHIPSIATSKNNPKINLLRHLSDLRDMSISKNVLGQFFINFYYTSGLFKLGLIAIVIVIFSVVDPAVIVIGLPVIV